jgi:DNA (cytosine-5)-methyltransferase 1
VKKQLGKRKLNIIAGGFPCQGFSVAGKRVVTDPRNFLYKQMLNVVKHLQPDFVVGENVPGLRYMQQGAVERKIVEDFRKAGYNMQVAILCAADYGVPQKRHRLIFIGNRISKLNYYPLPLIDPSKYKTVKDAISDLMNLPDNEAINHSRTKHDARMVQRMAQVKQGEGISKKYKDSYRRLWWHRPAITVKANHGAGCIHPRRNRVITAREMARLQSFDDDFIFEGSKTAQQMQIGNAVPPLLAKAIALAVKKSYTETPAKE